MHEETAIKGMLKESQKIERVVVFSCKIKTAIFSLKISSKKHIKSPKENAQIIEILRIILGFFLFSVAMFSEIILETEKLIPAVANVTISIYNDIIN